MNRCPVWIILLLFLSSSCQIVKKNGYKQSRTYRVHVNNNKQKSSPRQLVEQIGIVKARTAVPLISDMEIPDLKQHPARINLPTPNLQILSVIEPVSPQDTIIPKRDSPFDNVHPQSLESVSYAFFSLLSISVAIFMLFFSEFILAWIFMGIFVVYAHLMMFRSIKASKTVMTAVRKNEKPYRWKAFNGWTWILIMITILLAAFVISVFLEATGLIPYLVMVMFMLGYAISE